MITAYVEELEKKKQKVLQFIQDELVGYCQNGQYICDQIGSGSQLIMNN